MTEAQTRKLRALADAAIAIHRKGLSRCRDGWRDEVVPVHSIHGCHHFQTVNRLVEKGYLQLYCKGKTAHITDAGIAYLEQLRKKAVL